jgi:AGCS family alanine or glycine:cation symporter
LFTERYSEVYRWIFLSFVVVGSMTSASNILDFSDLMMLAMAFPNFIALYAFSGKVRSALDSYVERLRSGELDREAEEARALDRAASS